MSDNHKCCKAVYSRYGSHQCGRTASLEEGGRWYCKQHAPSAFAARRAATIARWQAAQLVRSAGYAVDNARRAVVAAAEDAVDQRGTWDAVADAVLALRKAKEAQAQAKAAQP